MLLKPWLNEDELLYLQWSYDKSFQFEIKNNTVDENMVSTFENQKRRIQDAIDYANKLEALDSNSSHDSSCDESIDNNTINASHNNLMELPITNFDKNSIDSKIIKNKKIYLTK
jgi:hypothetical protein